jgi:hypothetical protein
MMEFIYVRIPSSGTLRRCSCKNKRFGGTYRLHDQGEENRLGSVVKT